MRTLKMAMKAAGITVAVLSEDTVAYVLVIGDDRLVFEGKRGPIRCTVNRTPDALILCADSDIRMTVDLESELCLRLAQKIAIVFADEQGLHESGIFLTIIWS